MAEPSQGGTDEHARTKWAGQLETRGYLSRVRSSAHFARSTVVSISAYSMVGHPLESLPVPLTQNIMSTCIILRTVVPLALCGGVAPPSKILWGRLPSLPPPAYGAGLRSIRYVRTRTVLTLEATPTHDLRMRKNYNTCRTPPFH